MNKDNNTGRSLSLKIISTIIVLAIFPFVIPAVEILVSIIIQMSAGAKSEALNYSIFILMWIIILLLLCIKPFRPILKTFGHSASGNNYKKFLIGIGIGFVMNAVCVAVAVLHHDVSLNFVCFEPISLFIIYITVFIQSSAEEALCRGFLYQNLLKNWGPIVAVIGNGVIFATMHIGNDGMTFLAWLGMILVSTLFSMMVYSMNSMWCAMAAHTTWNYTQNIIFGLPNSGSPSNYSIFAAVEGSERNSFAYNAGFGVESSITVLVVICISILGIYLWSRKYGKEPLNVWEE